MNDDDDKSAEADTLESQKAEQAKADTKTQEKQS